VPAIPENDLEVEEAERGRDAAEVASDPPEPSASAETDEESMSVPAFELVRRILVGMVQAIEDGADLLGASVREELGRFRTDIVKSAIATSFLIAGGGLLTAGLAALMHVWLGTWPPVLLTLGGVYLVVGGLLFVSMGRVEPQEPPERRGQGDQR